MTMLGQGRKARPSGSRGQLLQQNIGPSYELLVTSLPGAPMPVDVTDRWARLLGQVDIARANGAAMAAANPLIAGIYNAAGNRMPSMDAVARPGFVDPIDRAARLLGVVYGSQAAQLLQKAATFELITEDTGLHTNPELWLHTYHWDSDLVTIVAAGAGGQQNLGAAVGAGATRRVRSLTVHHNGTVSTVLTLLVAAGATKLTLPIPAKSPPIKWEDEDGIVFTAGQQPAVQTSNVIDGSTYVEATGVEA